MRLLDYTDSQDLAARGCCCQIKAGKCFQKALHFNLLQVDLSLILLAVLLTHASEVCHNETNCCLFLSHAVPRWAIYTIFAVIVLLFLVCIIWVFVKYCCKSKKKRKNNPDHQINLQGVTGSTTTSLVSKGSSSSTSLVFVG